LGAKLEACKSSSSTEKLSGIIGWGLKDNTKNARTFARRRDLPFYSLEDGFIRSIGLGVDGAEPFGFILDRKGIYYNACQPSDLETLIKVNQTTDQPRARRLIQRLVNIKATKYNHVWHSAKLDLDQRPNILLIDQTYGDLSVQYGLADENSFQDMVDAALKQYPMGRLFVKTHPDVIAGKKKGYLTDILPVGVELISEDCNAIALIQKMDHVFTVTSQMGFEALLANKKVTCFGMPFYAGWGLTEDMVQCSRRGENRSLEHVFEAAYLNYVRYVDPITEQRCELERILDLIENHKRIITQNRGRIFCFGFRWWKRGIIRHFLGAAGTKISFQKTPSHQAAKSIDASSRFVVWGARDNKRIRHLARRHGIAIERVEDGFVRSVGLGSDYARPSSLILDRRGIYFDPRQPSDLEHLLNTVEPDEAAIARAQALRYQIVEAGISKYNNGCDTLHMALHRPGQRIILVPGQVENDASIQTGSVDVRTNLDLLKAVRQDNPDAHIVYKPHPDVTAGNRKGKVSAAEAHKYCDQIVTDCNINLCLDRADEVHTITSLTGFEALLRGKTVHTYGLPFYAGWGLTHDRHSVDRRRTERTLDELVYCCLILYPRYYHWSARCFVEVEDVIYDIEQKKNGYHESIAASLLERLVRKTFYLVQGLRP
jgi:capsular polysaccharide export protein